jgi:hypothetical protein
MWVNYIWEEKNGDRMNAGNAYQNANNITVIV